ncbi:unnamed protein product [Ceratitis capitata]|uniref:(Mediterranean fruit fly) hypothetical protein n=1 Tax=Ceratitis capitata TaxID=7213 RepID=A0A811U0G2_CERCA|nr:unnamed protein product [Ceratitis capitata]
MFVKTFPIILRIYLDAGLDENDWSAPICNYSSSKPLALGGAAFWWLIDDSISFLNGGLYKSYGFGSLRSAQKFLRQTTQCSEIDHFPLSEATPRSLKFDFLLLGCEIIRLSNSCGLTLRSIFSWRQMQQPFIRGRTSTQHQKWSTSVTSHPYELSPCEGRQVWTM